LLNTSQASTLWLWYAVAKGGPSTVTVTTTNSPGDGFAAVSEWQGPLVLDQNSGRWNAPGDSAPQSAPTITTGFIDEIVIGFFVSVQAVISGVVGWNLAGSVNGVICGPTTPVVWQDAPTAGVFTPEVSFSSTGNGEGAVSTSWVHGFVTSTISGNAGVAGATVTLSGTASAVTTADGSGNYSFANLVNGNYVITPSLALYTFSPTSRSETVAGADIPGVNFTAVAPEVDIAEVQITVFYQSAGNYLYARDVNSWGDGGAFGANNGTPYPICNVVIGSITLSQPGAPLFPLQHIVLYADAVGTLNNGKSSQPSMWILPNEVSAKAGIGFIQLPEIQQEPPEGQTHPSATILALRYPVNMMNSYLASQFIHHLQVKIQFEPENAPNTLKALAFKETQS
jgi:hypothetical protein